MIEPDIVYNYVNGVNNYARFIRFDEDETLTDTNEIQYGITQRLYRRKKDGDAEELIRWRLLQKYYFDRDLRWSVNKRSTQRISSAGRHYALRICRLATSFFAHRKRPADRTRQALRHRIHLEF